MLKSGKLRKQFWSMDELLQVVKLIIPRLSEINLNLTSGSANIFYETTRVPNSGDMCI